MRAPKTYRGLQIGSSLCKIMILIILDRLKPWYDEQLLDNQDGFRAGRSTADACLLVFAPDLVTMYCRWVYNKYQIECKNSIYLAC